MVMVGIVFTFSVILPHVTNDSNDQQAVERIYFSYLQRELFGLYRITFLKISGSDK